MRVKSPRDPRLDVFRGLCLVMIFINHVPKNLYEDYTSRNFGFSDAAEGFVLMSGIAAGLAYSADFRAPMRLWVGFGRVWKRVWTLYMVHILTTMAALASASAVAVFLHNSEVLFLNQMDEVFSDPLRAFIGLTLLTHQFGYVNILPLYLVLLAVAPLMLMAAWRKPLWLMAGSVLLWAAAGQWHLSLPNYPTPGGWFFNPLTWQVIFITGLLTGVAMKDGRRFVPVKRWLQVLTGGFVLFAAVAAQVPEVSKAMGGTLWLLQDRLGLPWFLTAFEKSYVTAPRLLHILALAYFLSTFPAVRRACGSVFAKPFELLGRQALPVFALGSVLCIAFQGVKHALGDSLALDSALLATGLAAQFALAAARQYWPKPRTS
ncbi:OpgC domain-containing protein [Gemmobacter straminiformis]|uniref:OpgC domain-containing protein n=2 Tax=Paragemmobacter straminiformis TaxID=2045119 RepID=A0A842IF69_9RHOB|nr:OpgC domain-containing protein [Gemmobacter straminiformis]